MIRISNLSKFYGDQTLFNNVNLSIHSKEKIGLIGRNGTGKSTFLKLILGEDEYQGGNIDIKSHTIIRTLEQSLDFEEETILEQVCSALMDENDEWKAKSILMGLGFYEYDFDRSPSEFSSGFQIRIRLAESLVSECDLLLLDEPTNYLDISSLRWLSRFLKEWNKSFVLITHDKHFMNEVVTHTIAIDRCDIKKIKGGPQKLIEQIKSNDELHEKTRKNQLKKREKNEAFIAKFRSGAASAGMVQSRIKALEKQKVGEKIESLPEIKFKFKYEEIKSDTLLSAENISFGYDDKKNIIEDFSLEINAGDKIGIIGKNGKGKSTLLNLLTNNLTIQSGKIKTHPKLKIGYFGTESKDSLNSNFTILEELNKLDGIYEQEIRNICGSLLFTGDNVKKKISNLSGGEKSRVCLAKVILRPNNILALDEPTNHLDMESCLVLSKSLKNFPGTVVFVTHNEDILSEVATKLILFDNGKISVLEKTYDEFLSSGGWGDENPTSKMNKNNSDKKSEYLDKKEQKKQLRLISKKIENLEKKIGELDKEKIKISSELNEACLLKDQKRIQESGVKLKNIDDKINIKYEEMEKLMKVI